MQNNKKYQSAITKAHVSRIFQG
jgi:hypothetical protein